MKGELWPQGSRLALKRGGQGAPILRHTAQCCHLLDGGGSAWVGTFWKKLLAERSSRPSLSLCSSLEGDPYGDQGPCSLGVMCSWPGDGRAACGAGTLVVAQKLPDSC